MRQAVQLRNFGDRNVLIAKASYSPSFDLVAAFRTRDFSDASFEWYTVAVLYSEVSQGIRIEVWRRAKKTNIVYRGKVCGTMWPRVDISIHLKMVHVPITQAECDEIIEHYKKTRQSLTYSRLEGPVCPEGPQGPQGPAGPGDAKSEPINESLGTPIPRGPDTALDGKLPHPAWSDLVNATAKREEDEKAAREMLRKACADKGERRTLVTLVPTELQIGPAVPDKTHREEAKTQTVKRSSLLSKFRGGISMFGKLRFAALIVGCLFAGGAMERADVDLSDVAVGALRTGGSVVSGMFSPTIRHEGVVKHYEIFDNGAMLQFADGTIIRTGGIHKPIYTGVKIRLYDGITGDYMVPVTE